MKKLYSILALAMVGLTFTACSDDDDDSGTVIDYNNMSANTVFVLNQGSYGYHIDGTLDCLSLTDSTMTRSVFQKANGRSLGGTPNDAIVLDDVLYIATTDENRVEVVNADNFKSITYVSVKQPRKLASDDDYVYVSSYTGKVYKISRDSYAKVDSTETIGSNLEGIALHDGYLYVCNSWNSDYTYNTNVVKVKASDMTKIKDITVTINPNQAVSTDDGVYVLSLGNYSDVSSNVEFIDDDDQVESLGIEGSMMAAGTDGLYIVNSPWGGTPSYQYYDFTSHQVSTFTTGSEIFMPYAIAVDKANGYICITSYNKDESTGYADYAGDGYLVRYSSNGIMKDKYTCGVNPGCIVINYVED